MRNNSMDDLDLDLEDFGDLDDLEHLVDCDWENTLEAIAGAPPNVTRHAPNATSAPPTRADSEARRASNSSGPSDASR